MHPGLTAWLEELGDSVVWAEIQVRRIPGGFELRHNSDTGIPVTELQRMEVENLRQLAMHTATGEFRPLKCAPNLVRGWLCVAADPASLWDALDHLYPGSVADWWAWKTRGATSATDSKVFFGRQTGMYKVANQLTDEQAAGAIQAACDARFCRKQRCWTVSGLLADPIGSKSRIPCLEPCAVMLEFARRTFRIEQDEPVQPAIKPGDLASMLAAIEHLLEHPASGREGDSGDPLNGRRLQRARNLLKPLMPDSKPSVEH